MTPEGKVKEKVKALLDAAGHEVMWYFMPAARVFGKAGVPDFIGVYMGRMFGIETKAGKNQPTALQVFQMGRIESAGGKTFVINEDNLYEIDQWMREVQNDAL